MDALRRQFGSRLLQNEPLAKYTAARLGGPADWLYVARDSLEDMVDVVATAWTRDIPVRVIGGGANILVSDKGVRGLVVINKVNEIQFGVWHEGRSVSATSGVSLTNLVNKCQSQGYAGFEWAVSVPGTVGGAIVNNAGAHGSSIANCLADVVVLEPTGPRMLDVEKMAYSYRNSILKGRQDPRFLVLIATFVLNQDDPQAIKARMDQYVNYRKQTQPSGASLGSIFKNPPGDYAGRLIEAAGLKGYRIGDVMISEKHANFFVNTGNGNATASAYLDLILHAQETVLRHSGVELELEIELIGDWSDREG